MKDVGVAEVTRQLALSKLICDIKVCLGVGVNGFRYFLFGLLVGARGPLGLGRPKPKGPRQLALRPTWVWALAQTQWAEASGLLGNVNYRNWY